MDLKEITLSIEEKNDYKENEQVTREAFWNHYQPGCDEHYLLHILRNSDAAINELNIVAKIDGTIVGNIIYSKAVILCDDGRTKDVITFGPLSVLPKMQGKGIGGRLIKYSLLKAKEMGYDAVIITGDPDYYSRFGFEPGEKYGIGNIGDMYSPALMAIELNTGSLDGCQGKFKEDEIFHLNREEVEKFDKEFPNREKAEGLKSQKRIIELIGMARPR